jgi:tryptophanyl-tRNA synthetase
MGLLERAHSYKDKTAKGQAASVGLFTYPVLMAADILAMQSEIVPVGRDQKQHLEITRDLAVKFHETYGQAFTLPEPEILESVAVIPGTDGQKMSKSYGNTIDLFADDAKLKKQVMSIVTNSTPKGEPLDPESCHVLALLRLVSPAQAAELKAEYLSGSVGYGDAKKILLEAILREFGPARARYTELMANPAAIDAVLAKGTAVARPLAQKTLSNVRRLVGLA